MIQRRQLRTLAVAAIVLLVAAVLAGLVFRGEYATSQTVRRAFAIDHDFTIVRKILVRKDAAKQIVAMGGDSEFVDQQWTGGDVALDKLKLIGSEWRAELHGDLRVRTLDDYVGRQEIELEQEVEIEPDFLHSQVKLKRPSGRLKEYAMTTRFDRDEAHGNARVELELTQEILTHAPWFAHGIADRRVRASAERTLANQEAAIRKLIEENLDDVPLLPLR